MRSRCAKRIGALLVALLLAAPSSAQPSRRAAPPAAEDADFLFVQMSDAHVYDRVGDFRRYSLPGLPRWLPDWLAAQLMLLGLDYLYYDRSRSEIVEGFRSAVQPYRDVRGRWSSGVLLSYLAEFERPGSELGSPAEHFRAAVAEIAALAPAFVVSTGDLVVEANQATPEAARRWLAFYRQVTRNSGLSFYDTIGNNELAGISSGAFPRDHPDYGKGLFRRLQGPTHYSFDRGAFHFVALDTHRQEADGKWVFDRMDPAVRAWLERDLAEHRDRVLVALNHEPFHTLPEWTFYEPADNEGLFARYGVDWSLAGHLHRNASVEIGATTHVTTGALSGMRWVMPADFHPRGYRLFYAHGRRLYSAWKQLGEPVLGFVAPPGESTDPALHAASKQAERGEGPLEVVAVAADAAGPFASLELRLDGEPLAFERWGDYFLRARIAPPAAGSRLELRARSADGAAQAASLTIR